jgi:hypothetical protein
MATARQQYLLDVKTEDKPVSAAREATNDFYGDKTR